MLMYYEVLTLLLAPQILAQIEMSLICDIQSNHFQELRAYSPERQFRFQRQLFYDRCFVPILPATPRKTFNALQGCNALTGMQGWRTAESTRLPPMWHGFDFQIRRPVYVGWVCWFSALHFLRVLRFPLPSKTSIWLELICVDCWFQFLVSPISDPALEQLDT